MFFRPAANGVILDIKVTPNASANEIAGAQHHDDGSSVLAVRVTASPEKGKANQAVIKLIAKHLHVPKSAITIAAGETARQKTIMVSGDPQALAAIVNALNFPAAKPQPLENT